MKREIYFLDHPDSHVEFRDAAIARLRAGEGPENAAEWLQLWQEELAGTVAAYSRGDALETVKERFLRAAEAYEYAALGGVKADITERDAYHRILWTLSLGMVLGLEPAAMTALNRALHLAGHDALLDTLLRVIDPAVEPVETFLHDGPFHHLVSAAGNKGEAGGTWIQKYLLAYLPELEKLPWYGSHVRQLPEFFGYWAFEVAAVVKAFHITDRLFADHIFYPRDLVHQRMFRTWLDGEQGDRDRREMDSALEEEETRAAMEELAGYFQKHYGGDGKQIPDALNLLARISGMSNEQLQENPEMMQQVVSRIFKGVIQANEGLREVLDSDELSPEVAAFIKSLKLDETGIPDAEFNRETMKEDLSEEQLRQLEAEGSPGENLRERYDKISDHLAAVLDKEKDGQLAFMEGLEHLVTALGMSITEESRDIKKQVADKVSAELREQRKGRNLANFDWSSLMPKKEGE